MKSKGLHGRSAPCAGGGLGCRYQRSVCDVYVMHMEVWGRRGRWQGRGGQRVYMANMRRTRAVGCATSISKACVMSVQRTWRSGGPAEVAKGQRVYEANTHRAQAVGCTISINETYVMSV